jgi:hypothetical protein
MATIKSMEKRFSSSETLASASGLTATASEREI